MLLDLSELLSGNCREKIFDTEIGFDEFDSSMGRFLVTGKCLPKITVTALGGKKYAVTGDGSVNLSIPCARCLEEVNTQVDFSIERELDFNDDTDESDERMEEMNYIDGYHLDVDKLVHTEILMSMPLRVLCSEDCKGLCYKCGANLNKGECGCDREQLDPRMSVIRDIFKNFKEV